MCTGCSNGSGKCKDRDFSTMPVIKVYADGIKAVKCSGHAPAPPAAPLVRRCISCDLVVHGELPEGQGLPCGH